MNVKVQDQSAASVPSPKKKFSDSKAAQDSKAVPDSFPLSKVQNGNDSLFLENVKHTDKANHQPRTATSPKSKGAGPSANLNPKCSNEVAHQQSNSLPGKSRPNVSAKSAEVRHKESNGTHDLVNATVSRQSIQTTFTLSSCIKHTASPQCSWCGKEACIWGHSSSTSLFLLL